MSNELSKYRECQVDPRIIDAILKSPEMLEEQGGSQNLMFQWGGPTAYKQVAKMEEPDRLTYMGYLKGFSGAQEISEVTGVPLSQVNRSLTALGRQGLVPEYKDLIYEEPIALPI